jgi:hypothetical protein
MNSLFPLNQINEEQAINKWKKLVARLHVKKKLGG